MAVAAPERIVRISRVAGRYLVFDIEDVLYIRRHHSICAVLTGTLPQNPTQNLFLGLPIELHAEEAKLLVDKKVGYVANELSDHLSRLASMDEAARKAYAQHLKAQRRVAQLALDEGKRAKAQTKHQSKRKAAKPATPAAASEEEDAAATADELSLFGGPAPTPKPSTSTGRKQTKEQPLPSITPTTSTSTPLLPPTNNTTTSSSSAPSAAVVIEPTATPSSYPFYNYLNDRGYFTTPGLRFGGAYSVYPGDPFRYHAHYLANSYGWDEEIAMLDLVTSGRLGTGVKKSFLFGAEKPAGAAGEGGEVRLFCIEWAGM